MYCTNTCLYTTEEHLESICVSGTNLSQKFSNNIQMYRVKRLKMMFFNFSLFFNAGIQQRILKKK